MHPQASCRIRSGDRRFQLKDLSGTPEVSSATDPTPHCPEKLKGISLLLATRRTYPGLTTMKPPYNPRYRGYLLDLAREERQLERLYIASHDPASVIRTRQEWKAAFRAIRAQLAELEQTGAMDAPSFIPSRNRGPARSAYDDARFYSSASLERFASSLSQLVRRLSPEQ